MNIKNSFLLVLLSAIFTLSSCSRDDSDKTPNPTPTSVTPDPINNFVWKAMNSWYYWQEKVPSLADTFDDNATNYANFINYIESNPAKGAKTPDKLFYSLLYDYGTTDHFSWIEKDNTIISSKSRIAEVEKLSGLEFGLFPKGGGSSNYVALITYVIPNSSAANAGLKRGDLITKVNGSYINESNYTALNSDNFNISRAETSSVALVNNAYVVTTTDKIETINISKTNVEENPIAHYQVYEMAGKKIGYLVFNAFKIDYNDELNAQFAKMKADGITELILDLRYNGGGSLTTALGLAQMINGSFTGQPYVFMDFNTKHNKYDGFDNLSNNVGVYNVVNGHPEKTGNQTINSLSLPKIYALISFQTASASELTVSCLSKYINVETIGYLTVGKFVGSITLYDSPSEDYESYDNRNKNHTWQLQPITFAYYNKDKDPYPTVTLNNGQVVPGIVPKQENRIHPYQWINNIKDFGVTTDPELKKALELITGQTISNNRKMVSFADTKQKVFFRYTNPSKGLNIPDMEEYLKRRK